MAVFLLDFSSTSAVEHSQEYENENENEDEDENEDERRVGSSLAEGEIGGDSLIQLTLRSRSSSAETSRSRGRAAPNTPGSSRTAAKRAFNVMAGPDEFQ